ncbi:PMP-22/EMP/MP20/Claudin superfamily [Cinara cedri]|uniref:PMP-22/EMP/MP20/Claudin superfamily n=1 Tax=Cinara cedri TaxID=506608 RepID=A0A5E4MBH1_9HEMI|nr:PMP-22/EMP/MP20/Claudin superfamily [Cinara cedri]
MMKKRSFAGNVALALFVLASVFVFIAFFSASWLVSDSRITGSQLERFGLWTHCFRSLPDPTDLAGQRVFVGCHWIFDPFTKGYNKIRGFLLPFYIVATQFFYTITFLGTLLSTVGSLMFLLCCMPEDKYFIQINFVLGITLIVSGICAALAVLIFALFANQPGWMPGHENNYFGWAFGVAIASFFALLASGGLYLVEKNIQVKKRNCLKESQTKFDLETI